MLATDILTEDHRVALALVDALKGTRNEEAGNREKFERLESALFMHMQAEEDVFYPALAENDEFGDIMDDMVPEHEMVRANLAQMSELSVTDPIFQQVLLETEAALRKHMTNEEDEIFPRSVEVLGEERIREMGNLIDQLRSERMTGTGAGA
jgi:iron-sulfur cluster repair protein YtfE (RIC family)